jgi:hypothetical protein
MTGPVGVGVSPQLLVTTGGVGVVMADGQATVAAPLAGTVSGMFCTTIDLEQVAALPQASVALQVRVWVTAPGQAPGTKTSVKVITGGIVVHPSVAVGATQTGVAGQMIGVVCATQLIIGGVSSYTTIDLEQVAELPQASVAVQVRVWVPVPGQAPGTKASVKVTIGGAVLQPPVAIGGVKTGVAGQLIGVVCVVEQVSDNGGKFDTVNVA